MRCSSVTYHVTVILHACSVDSHRVLQLATATYSLWYTLGTYAGCYCIVGNLVGTINPWQAFSIFSTHLLVFAMHTLQSDASFCSRRHFCWEAGLLISKSLPCHCEDSNRVDCFTIAMIRGESVWRQRSKSFALAIRHRGLIVWKNTQQLYHLHFWFH